MPLSETHIVSQGRELYELTNEANLDLQTLKLLNAYLSAINPKDSATNSVMFTVREFAEITGVQEKGINLELLRQHLSKLTSLTISRQTENELLVAPAFAYAYCAPKEIGGRTMQTIKIQCSQIGSYLFFDITRRGYLKYRLKNVGQIKSGYCDQSDHVV